MIGVFKELNAAELDGASALEIFGRESVIAATSLANAANSGDFDAFIAKINEGVGTADAMREVMESGLPGGVARFMSAIEGLQIALGDAGLTRYISGALQALTDLVRRFEDAPGPVKTVGALFFTLGPILLGLAFATKVVSFAIGGLMPLMSLAAFVSRLWSGSLIILRLQLLALAVQQYAAAAATWVLNIAMAANPVVLIVLGIIALIAVLGTAAYFIWRFRDAILEGLGAAWNWVKDNWPLLLAILSGPFGLAVYAIIRYRDQIIGIITGLGGQDKGNMGAGW